MAKKLTAQERLERQYAPIRECRSDKQIAELLKSKHIKGVPGDAESCPIGVFLRKKPWVKVWVAVNTPIVVQATNADGETAEIKMNKAAISFVKKFDNGFYDDLAEPD